MTVSKILFGKYKQQEVSEITDIPYLVWLVKTHRNPDADSKFRIPDAIAAEAKAVLDAKEGKTRTTTVGYRQETTPQPLEDNKSKYDDLRTYIAAKLAENKEKQQGAEGAELVMLYLGFEQAMLTVMDFLGEK
jgi:hypothetical protein